MKEQGKQTNTTQDHPSILQLELIPSSSVMRGWRV